MKIYLLRHAEDPLDIVGGWSDVGITFKGRKEVTECVQFFKKNQERLKIKKVISSRLKRCKQTIEPISKVLGCQVDYDPLWNGLNQGQLNGLTSDIATRFYADYALEKILPEQCFPGGESPKMFAERVFTSFQNLIKNFRNLDGNILVCTHGANMLVLEAFLMGKKWKYYEKINFKSCTLMEIDTDLKKISMELIAHCSQKKTLFYKIQKFLRHGFLRSLIKRT